MAEPLRPLSTGELLDRAFSLYRNNFLLFVGIAAPAPAIYLILQSVFAVAAGVPANVMPRPVYGAASPLGAGLSPSAALTLVAGGVATIFAYMVGLSISQAATVRAVSAVYLSQATTIRECYRSLRARFWTIIGVFLSVALRVFGGSVLLLAAGGAILGLAIGGGVAFGTAAAVVGGIIGVAALIGAAVLSVGLFVRYSLAVQACIAERLKIGASLKRSAFLAKGSRKKILTVYTVFVVLSWIAVVVLSLILGVVAFRIGPGVMRSVATYGASFISGVLVSPLVTIAMSLVYYDERVRKEAFDLQLMMSSLDGPDASSAAVAG